MPYRSANPFSSAALMRGLAPITERFPRLYLGILSIMAGAAYGLLLGIPLLLFVSLLNFYRQASSLIPTVQLDHIIGAGSWGLISLYAGILSWKLLRMKLPLPQGLMIKPESFPALQAILQRTYEHFQIKPFSRIVMTERFEVSVTYTPRFGLPVWSTATLCLGLPVLQCLSTTHFSCLLTGKIGQHAAPYSRWLHYLNKSRQLFKCYQQHFDRHHSWTTLPLRLFFRMFQPLFTTLSVFISHWEEIEADRYRLEIYSDADLLDTILTTMACQQFLQKHYWPNVITRLQKESLRKALPHSRMSAAIRRALAGNKVNSLLHEVFKKKFDGKNHSLPLKKRLENIGYDKLRSPSILIQNAAHELLGEGEKKIIEFMDKFWISRNLAEWKKVQQKIRQKQSALARLEKQSIDRLLSADELWKQARLTEKLRGPASAIPFYQALLKKDAQHARGLFAYGRILLRRGDERGVKLLEQSMSNEANLTPQACRLLFKFLLKNNQKQHALLYRNRGLSFKQQQAA